MAIITLTTDFGTADGYVGAMKGVIVRLAGSPAPMIVDLAHEIAPGDIAHAAWVVATSTLE
ncbi:MAG: SAM-dependent chlorinase/fluorinase, partial [Deltaproteobacteria bacterium]